jgi:hypothetical protein
MHVEVLRLKICARGRQISDMIFFNSLVLIPSRSQLVFDSKVLSELQFVEGQSGQG